MHSEPSDLLQQRKRLQESFQRVMREDRSLHPNSAFVPSRVMVTSITVRVPFSSAFLLAGAAPRPQDTGADTTKPSAIETAALETASSFEI
jgi:hypothetical protein